MSTLTSIVSAIAKVAAPLVALLKSTPALKQLDDGSFVATGENMLDVVATRFIAILAGVMGAIALSMPFVNPETANTVGDHFFKMMNALWYGGTTP